MAPIKFRILSVRTRGWWLAIGLAALPLILAACNSGGGNGY